MPAVFFSGPDRQSVQNASAGNRTRVTSMATMYSTTRPLMPVGMVSASCCMHAFNFQCIRAELNIQHHMSVTRHLTADIRFMRARPMDFEPRSSVDLIRAKWHFVDTAMILKQSILLLAATCWRGRFLIRRAIGWARLTSCHLIISSSGQER